MLPQVEALVAAQGDYRLVAEQLAISEAEAFRMLTEHKEEINAALVEDLKFDVLRQLKERVPDMSVGELHRTYEVIHRTANSPIIEQNNQFNNFPLNDSLMALAKRMNILDAPGVPTDG